MSVWDRPGEFSMSWRRPAHSSLFRAHLQISSPQCGRICSRANPDKQFYQSRPRKWSNIPEPGMRSLSKKIHVYLTFGIWFRLWHFLGDDEDVLTVVIHYSEETAVVMSYCITFLSRYFEWIFVCYSWEVRHNLFKTMAAGGNCTGSGALGKGWSCSAWSWDCNRSEPHHHEFVGWFGLFLECKEEKICTNRFWFFVVVVFSLFFWSKFWNNKIFF